MTSISIFGFTGSIGTQALNLLQDRNDYSYDFFVCGSNVEEAEKILNKFSPKYIYIDDLHAKDKFNKQKFPKTLLINTYEELISLLKSEPSDIYLSAISGFNNVELTMLAASSGKRLLLANKESLVIMGEKLIEVAKKNNTNLIPIDSEHYSAYLSLSNAKKSEVKMLYLTASGGPFEGLSVKELSDKTAKEALNHPNWDMGDKITIDSATLVNKCFEIIEAHYLFDLDASELGIVIHPQSVIHSLLEFKDGSIEAQMSKPDMAFPIAYGLFNNRVTTHNNKDLISNKLNLELKEFPEDRKFLLEIVDDVIQQGGNRGLIFATLNNYAVEKFLNGEIKFCDIYNLIESNYKNFEKKQIFDLEELMNDYQEIKNKLVS